VGALDDGAGARLALQEQRVLPLQLLVHCARSHRGADAGAELLGSERLHQEVVRAGRQATGRALLLRVDRHHDERHRPEHRVAPELEQQIQPAHPGHV
jgi:hypothetical protein